MPNSTEHPPVFDAAIVTAVLAHMNGDHPDDNQLIARAFGHETATAAAMTSLDHHGGTWRYELGGNTVVLTVPWTTEIGERAEIRREIVVLYEAACARLGLTPRPH